MNSRGFPDSAPSPTSRTVASLTQTLQIFRALLTSSQEPSLSDEDNAIWTYPTPIQGLHAQSGALGALIRGVEEFTNRPPLMTALQDDPSCYRVRLDQSLPERRGP